MPSSELLTDQAGCGPQHLRVLHRLVEGGGRRTLTASLSYDPGPPHQFGVWRPAKATTHIPIGEAGRQFPQPHACYRLRPRRGGGRSDSSVPQPPRSYSAPRPVQPPDKAARTDFAPAVEHQKATSPHRPDRIQHRRALARHHHGCDFPARRPSSFAEHGSGGGLDAVALEHHRTPRGRARGRRDIRGRASVRPAAAAAQHQLRPEMRSGQLGLPNAGDALTASASHLARSLPRTRWTEAGVPSGRAALRLVEDSHQDLAN